MIESATNSSPRAPIVLVSDLDGTLSRTDTLHEGVLKLAATRPLQILKLAAWLAAGRARFKARLADRVVLESEDLPLNPDVIKTLKTARQEGRPTALVSAADHRQVEAVARTTDLFDEAHGTRENLNLKGAAKAAFLVEHFGEKGFDYIGDSSADIPVWAAAHTAITVNASPRLRRAAEAANAQVNHLGSEGRPGVGKAMLKALRPHQWSKNILLFLPILAAHNVGPLFQVVLGFLAFCAAASAAYVINDLMDLSADRAHPRKKARPFASGELSAGRGITMAFALLVLSLTLGLQTGNPTFLAVLAAYFGMTFAYSLWLKRKLIIDVLMLGGLYAVRIIAGAAAASVRDGGSGSRSGVSSRLMPNGNTSARNPGRFRSHGARAAIKAEE